MMSPTPDASKAVLYSPYGGLELFDSRADLLIEVQERLAHPAKREELMQFVSIGERDALPVNLHLTVSTAVIPGAVMEDQEQAILAGQQKCDRDARPVTQAPQLGLDARHIARHHGPLLLSRPHAERYAG